MQLKCRIKDKDYNVNLVQGSVFQEEYNEQLDSATIKISGVHEIKDLKPYDDVFLYDGVFDGYPNNSNNNSFYKHFLVDQYSEVLKNIKDKLYEYTIDLFSETKKLEAIQLPNISITQPLNINNKLSVWTKLNQFVTLYSPTYKKVVKKEYDGLLGTEIQSKIANTELISFLTPISDFYWVDSETLGTNTRKIDLNEMSNYFYNTFFPNETGKLLQLDFNIPKENVELTTGVTLRVYNTHMTAINVYYRDNTEDVQLFFDAPLQEFVLQLKPNKVLKKIEIYTYATTGGEYLSVEGLFAGNYWEYKRKYTLSPSLEPIFNRCYCPDFSLNNPSLKDVLTQLMLTKDMIPYVKDDVIYGLDISKRNGSFNFDVGRITNVTSSMTSDNFVDNLRRNYTNALSQERSARRCEFLGFRNSDNALMTIENMRVETQFPIYKINKVLMCYYKKGVIRKRGTNGYTGKDFVFLCKQDITPLVQLNSSRNLLSSDWNNFSMTQPQSIQDLAKYKLCTLGYDIGSKQIVGWGTKYTYPSGWWDLTTTYLENILKILESNYKYGIYTYSYVTELAGNRLEADEYIDFSPNFTESIVNIFSNNALNLKSFVFEIDYNAFFNGAVVHSKDEALDDITINDNSSSSLTLLEKDGLFQKEKANRFGNKAVVINAVYQDISELQPLGSVYGDDIVIYHREYAITDKTIQATYYGTKDYVLKNYFVSVYAKHRTYNLMSYGESVNRAENKKMYLLLSKNHTYYDDVKNTIGFTNFTDIKEKLLLSAFTPSEKTTSIDFIKYPYKIDCAFINRGLDSYYLSDVNAFVSGNSICFNTKMFDNVSAGVYIQDKEPGNVSIDAKKDFTGSVQGWNLLVDNTDTGYIEKLGIYVGCLDKAKLYGDDRSFTDEMTAKNIFNNGLRFLPKLINPRDNTQIGKVIRNKIGGEYLVYKDNKETIDMTLQIEPITDDYHNIFFSHWLMKLSDLLSSYTKIEKDYIQTDTNISDMPIVFKSMGVEDNSWGGQTPLILIEMNIADVERIKDKTNIFFNYVQIKYDDKYTYGVGDITRLRYGFKSIKNFEISSGNVNGLTINFDGTLCVYEGDEHTGVGEDAWYPLASQEMKFNKIDFLLGTNCPSGKVWFSNCKEFIGVHAGEVALLKENEIVYKNPNLIYPERIKWKFGRVNSIILNKPMIEGTNVESISRGIATDVESKPYYKNMFVRLVEQPMKKELVYNLYTSYQLENEPNSLLLKNVDVSSIFAIMRNDNGSYKIRVDLREVKNRTVKYQCMQYWYLEKDKNTMNFVFGVNITEQDLTKGYIDINISLLSKRDIRVYDDKHNVIGEMYDYSNNTQNLSYGSGLYFSSKK